MIDPELAEHAENFECVCGNPLEVGVAIVCSKCKQVPEKCKCPEVKDGK